MFRQPQVKYQPLLASAGLLALGLASAVWQTHDTEDHNQRQITGRLAVLAQEENDILVRRLQTYQYGLRGMRGAIVAVGPDQLSRAKVLQYLATRDLPTEFPGATGTGFIRRVPRSEEARFLRQARGNDQPDFHLYQLAPHPHPDRFVIQYIEPLEGNLPARGLDVASESGRYQAAMDAARQHRAVLTPPLKLVQTPGNQRTGFLVLLPVYRQGMPLATPDQRWAATAGWAYMPLLIRELLQDFYFRGGQYHLSISDNTAEGQPLRFYDSARSVASAAPPLLGAAYTLKRQVLGRQWQMEFHATPQFAAALNLPQPRLRGLLVALGSVLLSGLLYVGLLHLQRRREAALADARMAAIVNSASDGIISRDLQGRITSWNPAAERIFGYPAAAVLGQDSQPLLVPPNRREEDQHMLDEIRHNRSLPPLETVRQRRDGSLCRVGITASPLHGPEGEVTGVVSMVRDMTERHAFERQLQHLVEQMQMAVELARIGMWTWTVGSPHIEWDERMHQFFGLEARSGPVGLEQAFAVVHPDDRPQIERHFHHMQDSTKPLSYSFRGLQPDGQVRFFKASAILERDAQDDVRRVVGITREVTAEMQAAASLEALNAQLEQLVQQRTHELQAAMQEAQRADNAKTEFLSSMSHELRTPLHAILGFGQLLESDPALDSDQLDCVDEVMKAGRHLLSLINEVLELSKIDAGQLRLELAPVELGGLMRECCQLLQPLAQQRRIALRLHPSHDGQGLYALADRTRLRQVLLNLLGNAIQYNHPEGWVELAAPPATSAGHVALAVRDNGWGMGEDTLAHLYEPFQRGGQADNHTSGTGIGLSISKRLVEHMHGTLECSSALGQGSEFRLQLPQTSAPTAAPRPASDDDTPPTALPDASGGTILCIDDNPANLKLIVRMLEPLSHTRVLWAQMPRLGIELAIAHQPDLILLDINMPDLDGYQVLEQLRQVPALQHTPVVAITANAMPSDVEHGLRAGFTDYLTKPLDSSVFLPKVSQWLP